jgi:hypothetical protein
VVERGRLLPMANQLCVTHAASAQAATEVSKYIRFLAPEATVGMLYMMEIDKPGGQ